MNVETVSFSNDSGEGLVKLDKDRTGILSSIRKIVEPFAREEKSVEIVEAARARAWDDWENSNFTKPAPKKRAPRKNPDGSIKISKTAQKKAAAAEPREQMPYALRIHWENLRMHQYEREDLARAFGYLLNRSRREGEVFNAVLANMDYTPVQCDGHSVLLPMKINKSKLARGLSSSVEAEDNYRISMYPSLLAKVQKNGDLEAGVNRTWTDKIPNLFRYFQDGMVERVVVEEPIMTEVSEGKFERTSFTEICEMSRTTFLKLDGHLSHIREMNKEPEKAISYGFIRHRPMEGDVPEEAARESFMPSIPSFNTFDDGLGFEFNIRSRNKRKSDLWMKTPMTDHSNFSHTPSEYIKHARVLDMIEKK